MFCDTLLRMRASRLLSLLMLLQTRGRMTAPELARALEVSVRTVYRDIESLEAAGVPVYAERGPAGGFALLDGYRTRLTGLSGDEAESLFLTGVPEVAAELGLGSVLAAAELKLLAALPPESAGRAGRIRERFHLDAPGWFHESEASPFLEAVADAVWNATPLRVRYRRWGAEVDRDLDPLGLVLKSGTWYLVAWPTTETGRREGGEAERNRGTEETAERGARTYRVSRILTLETLPGRGSRPEGFELAGYWRGWLAELAERVYTLEVVVRVAPWVMPFLPQVLQTVTLEKPGMPPGPADADGWRTITLAFESAYHATLDLLRFGPDLEVISPPEVIERMRETARAVAGLYGNET